MKKVILNSRPSGMVNVDNFNIVDEEIPKAHDGEILIKTQYLSVDPYMRNRMNNVESYVKPFEVDGVINGDGIAEVVESKSEHYKQGDLVVGTLPWQEYSVISGMRLEKIDSEENLSPTAYLGALGLTGLTAYFGLLHIGEPKSGETVVISAAVTVKDKALPFFSKKYRYHMKGNMLDVR